MRNAERGRVDEAGRMACFPSAIPRMPLQQLLMPLHQNLRGRIDGIKSGRFMRVAVAVASKKFFHFLAASSNPVRPFICSLAVCGQVFLLPAGNIQSLVLVHNQTGVGVVKGAL
jgi:hypothetical protein